jgi:hypothetical protein
MPTVPFRNVVGAASDDFKCSALRFQLIAKLNPQWNCGHSADTAVSRV